MAEEYDVVVFGAGHNGLTQAAYMAKAGLSACVLEKNPWVGGGCLTQEIVTPGFKHDICSGNHIAILANPLYTDDELGLRSKYGLKYYFPEAPYAVLFPDGRAWVGYQDLDKMCSMIAKDFSERDAEAYRKFIQWATPGLQMVATGLYNPPAPFGGFMAMLDQSEDGREILRALLMSTLDLLDDWFEDEFVKIALARYVTETMVGPGENGTALYSYMMNPWCHQYGLGIAEGGSGALSDKLEALLNDAGATIRTESPVKRVIVGAGGEAKGVILESGEKVLAKKALVSGLHVKQLYLQMLSSEELPGAFQNKVKRLKQNAFMPFVRYMSLNEAPEYKAGPEVKKAAHVEFVNGSMEGFRRHFEEYNYDKVQTDGPLMQVMSQWDPTRAPEGKHTGYLYHYEPYNLKEGPEHWDEIKESVGDEIVESFRTQTTNMGDENIIGYKDNSPLDIERHNSAMIQGDFMHLGNYFHQILSNRPMPGWGHYRTPVDKLYMCGSCTHPGGGIIAGSGRACAQVVCEDLGIDFETLTK